MRCLLSPCLDMATRFMQERAALEDKYEMELGQLRRQLEAVRRDGGVPSMPVDHRPPQPMPSFRFGTCVRRLSSTASGAGATSW
jgi:hypothetical protein